MQTHQAGVASAVSPALPGAAEVVDPEQENRLIRTPETGLQYSAVPFRPDLVMVKTTMTGIMATQMQRSCS